MQINTTDVQSFPVDVAIAPYLRVVLTAGFLALAGEADRELGTTQKRVLTPGSGLGATSSAAVVLRNAGGTVKMIAAGAIAANALVYGAADGKVNDVANGNVIGRSITATTADGDEIEVLRFSDAAATSAVEAHTADDTLTAGESGTTHSTVGAVGTVVLSLPAATVGLEYWFAVGAAQELRIDPNGTETISLPSTGVPGAAGKYLAANAIGETVHLKCCSAGSWRVFGFTGTWTAEA